MLLRVNLGYELRTVRPDIDKLNPYIDNSDPMNIKKGNPLLDPERSHNISMSLAYGSISVKDPFEYSRYLTRVIGSYKFRQTTRTEQRGYIIGFSIRGNFGRFRERVDREAVITDDRTRATIESKLP